MNQLELREARLRNMMRNKTRGPYRKIYRLVKSILEEA